MKKDVLMKWSVWGMAGIMMFCQAGWSQGEKAAQPAKTAVAKSSPAKTTEAAKPATTTKSSAGKTTSAKKGTKRGKGASTTKKETPPPMELPWDLRNHITITGGKGIVHYAEANAEWGLDVEGMGNLIKGVDFRVTLADGTSLDASMLGTAEPERELPVTSEIGKSKAYVTRFPAKNGLEIHHRIEMYCDRPCLLVHVVVGNISTAPIEIARISPVVIRPGQMAALGSDAEVIARKMQFVGVSPVFDKTGPVSLVSFRLPGKEYMFSLGVLPQAVPAANAQFAPSGASWAGDVTCTYAPAIRLEPGQKIDASAWLTIAVPDTKMLDTYYSWIASMAPHVKSDAEKSMAWVTVEKGQGEEDLLAALKGWNEAKVAAALVPMGWEGVPGSLEGGSAGYSKELGKLAKRIHREGAKAGLTVDPLRISGGQAAWATQTPDGQPWLNLSNPEAKKFCMERIKKLTEHGFDFLVVASSAIPDEVLKRFNMTRPMAQTLALETVAEAAGNKAVYPASAATALQSEEAAWKEASLAAGNMAYYGVTIAPVRFAAAEVASVDANVAKAMALYTGPIELVGKPQGDVAKQLACVCAPGSVRGIPGQTINQAAVPETTVEADPEPAEKVAKGEKKHKDLKTEEKAPEKAENTPAVEPQKAPAPPEKTDKPKKKWLLF